jgi:hypothetical protein
MSFDHLVELQNFFHKFSCDSLDVIDLGGSVTGDMNLGGSGTRTIDFVPF